VKTRGVNTGEDFDTVFLSEAEETVTMPVLEEHLHIYEKALTVDWSDGDMMIGQISRDSADVLDDHTDGILIVGIQLLIDRTIT